MKYEIKVSQEFSDHVIVDANSETEARCLVEDCVADGKISAVEAKGTRGGGFREYDFRVEPLYQTDDPPTVVIKEAK